MTQLSTYKLEHYGRHFPDDIFEWSFFNRKLGIVVCIAMKYVPKVPVDINSALHQIVTWNQVGVKPLYEVIMTQFTHAYMGYEASMSETHYIA